MNTLYGEQIAGRLYNFAETYRESYSAANPYPHIVIDNFLPEEILVPILDNFPDPEKLKWQKFNDPEQKKLAFASVEKLEPKTREFVQFFNSSIVLQFLEKLTGIAGIISDPYFTGGGLHQIQRGGKLGVHVDFNKLDKFNLDRRLNLLIYLNKEWKDEYGGHFELWDESMKSCQKKVLPIFNRCVVFSTTETSFHGHPDPLTCPEGRTRKSIALYYYTNGRPEREVSKNHSTIFRKRPGENGVASKAKSVARAVLPPIVFNAISKLRGN